MKMINRPTGSIILLASLLALTACQSANEKTAPQLTSGGSALAQPAPLDAYLWELIELNGESLSDGEIPAGAHLIFLEAEARIAGSTVCNRLMGRYEKTSDHGFQLSNLATTRMACPDAAHEAAFLEVLRRYHRADVGASRIRLLDIEGATLAVFEARPLPR